MDEEVALTVTVAVTVSVTTLALAAELEAAAFAAVAPDVSDTVDAVAFAFESAVVDCLEMEEIDADADSTAEDELPAGLEASC